MKLNQDEINEIYARNYNPCIMYVLKNSGTRVDAEDNYQNTWIKLFEALDKGKEIKNLDGFIWGTNKILWKVHLRKRQIGDFY